MGNLRVFFLLFKKKTMSLDKIKHTVLRKNEADTYKAPVFAPDYSFTVLVEKYVPPPMSILCTLLDFYELVKLLCLHLVIGVRIHFGC
jgi:hypothetical protein